MAQLFHIRTINGVIPPVPSELKIAYYTLDKDSYTTASGLLKRNPVATKYKFFLTFPPMNKLQMTTVLQMLNSETLVVQYEDIFSGTVKTGNFYHGDIETSIYQIKNESNSDILFNPFTINLIQY